MLRNVMPHSQAIVITGANGQLGCALLRELARRGRRDVRALVRSQRARSKIEELALDPSPEIRIVDYTSVDAMREALRGAGAVVHLVGIIKETPDTRYVDAHEASCRVLARAAEDTDLGRIVYLSILGSREDSKNACLSSKGRAEALLLESRIPTTVLRVPMVLGGDDPASASLRNQARARRLWLVGGGRSLQQPIDARDVVRAILAAIDRGGSESLVLDAGGPTCLAHRDLVLRAARLWQLQPPRLLSIPPGVARLAVALLSALLPRPPITLPMFDILQHDDQADPKVISETLGLQLTPLDQTLSDHVGPPAEG
ncbi:MAG: NAD(P)H-binding protein [Deltaproteobacteria bacterium]|jgi:NADH dehydrogenase|nr:NAD(P)H-binding protein [Deltaproteobacteria bacterium]